MARSFIAANGDHILIPFKSAQNMLSTQSVSCWAWFNTVAARQDLFDSWNLTSGNKEKWLLTLISSPLHIYYFTSFNGSSAAGLDSTVAPSINTWYNIVGTYNGTNLKTVYVTPAGGATVSTSNDPGATGLFSTNIGISIGCDDEAGGPKNFTNGKIADCAIWNVELTATEVAGLAKGVRPYVIRPSSLVGWWPLDGIQSPEPDLSGFVANGTLTGTALAFGPAVMPFTPRWPQMIQPPAVVTPQIVHPLLSRRVELLTPFAAALAANPKLSRRSLLGKGKKQ